MGIVNATPDSFSDGGSYDPLSRARQLIAEGADVLDIGGESTRPGAAPVSIEDEIARVAPLIEAIRAEWSGPISIDTLKPEVARAAFNAGATIWNDVTALTYAPDSLSTAAELNADVILMHMQGEPRTMQTAPHYTDVVVEVEAWLLDRAKAAIAAGIARDRIWLDPGIGFGKALEHNLALIRATERLASHGFPLLMAASRKRFIAALEERDGDAASDATQRIGGTMAVHLYAAQNGARMLRVHDVAAMKQALRLWQALT
ncbi:dihydropteroate synthase [Asticcacaulis sp. YBE204]|uniref:dihydropteroate synthase n=1 Tax=Asticcacaulis sp. YBE204 TaxID=1282363 RepID=UPI0003C40257|nr:dihydropteroate synthase [Asticcacaulis sp. YBE204]ESQ79898.1 dihydropteroate synthase [Asticcacaulis sp. YBE204]